ncbi:MULTISPECIES: prepilin-type N-terminal cleavage/methylation domain-containing protein [Pontibacillus]|uniref:Prepilin-type N-terminal cleavage/methylation domain-containing protein n=1 Tax=Pontibacillus chungwhensis TaxID=265426 RepID=A0ABY8V0C5_9BACI|nr:MULTISPECIES: prepilin-type N-terminal cleavage/methylation domain-containing protein [Pontibacillus]MCD5325679.1 prepilin-type N-terminal cleavage/methylation domain-containing protein [Pontibacillus sp. HN14]WIF98079.1 prepilin-type N-terminal cleavage/methylation domain-containing protein [Pontibacillus chungwhensis]
MNNFKSERGITLIEIIASIAILAIIILAFMPMFTQTMRTSSISTDILDATYLAQSKMEEVYHLSTTSTFDDAKSQIEDMSLVETENSWYHYEQTTDDYYIYLSIKEPQNELSNVLVKVYRDNTKSKLESQMESIYRWEN